MEPIAELLSLVQYFPTSSTLTTGGIQGGVQWHMRYPQTPPPGSKPSNAMQLGLMGRTPVCAYAR